jgi:hypothetical protein
MFLTFVVFWGGVNKYGWSDQNDQFDLLFLRGLVMSNYQLAKTWQDQPSTL